MHEADAEPSTLVRSCAGGGGSTKCFLPLLKVCVTFPSLSSVCLHMCFCVTALPWDSQPPSPTSHDYFCSSLPAKRAKGRGNQNPGDGLKKQKHVSLPLKSDFTSKDKKQTQRSTLKHNDVTPGRSSEFTDNRRRVQPESLPTDTQVMLKSPHFPWCSTEFLQGDWSHIHHLIQSKQVFLTTEKRSF